MLHNMHGAWVLSPAWMLHATEPEEVKVQRHERQTIVPPFAEPSGLEPKQVHDKTTTV